ncbi:MAG: hypothetical protein JWM94_1388 [Sphingomonas bacterium]|nr:hypothetical protein [Sphingomonas bacterium]
MIKMEGILKYLIALALAFWPCSAFAAPVYLRCHLVPDGKDVGAGDLANSAPMEVTLNEDVGMVTYKFAASGRAYTARGIFTAGKVQFNGFMIDRTNLSFQRTSLGQVDNGECTLIEIKRAF